MTAAKKKRAKPSPLPAIRSRLRYVATELNRMQMVVARLLVEINALEGDDGKALHDRY